MKFQRETNWSGVNVTKNTTVKMRFNFRLEYFSKNSILQARYLSPTQRLWSISQMLFYCEQMMNFIDSYFPLILIYTICH